MTAKEADIAARSRVPVFFRGIVYPRITEVGYSYDELGNRLAYVTMKDPNATNSVTSTKVENVKLASDVTDEETKMYQYEEEHSGS